MKRNIFILFALSILLVGCNGGGNGGKGDTSNNGEDTIQAPPQEVNKIAKAIFYLENSASVFGYVNGDSEYVKVVSELATKPQFIEDGVNTEFNFVNGGENIAITKIGDKFDDLKNKLNVPGYRCGDITKSNLNEMFKLALSKAKKDTISILISDAIYDIGDKANPLAALATEGKQTRTKFIERLNEGDVQTIIVKLSSDFNGTYYPVRGGTIKLKQKRPFYVFIFGETELLNKYFPDKYIKEKLAGYSNVARFLKLGDLSIPYQATALKRKGQFIFDSKDKNKLLKIKKNSNGEFQFTFATDFSSLPFSKSYITSTSNYSINNNNNYTITNTFDKTDEILSGLKFAPTHLITVQTNKNPYGQIEVSLINKVPSWIESTNSNDESDIRNDTEHTFGFEYLTNGISEAYQYKNKEASIATFKFELKK